MKTSQCLHYYLPMVVSAMLASLAILLGAVSCTAVYAGWKRQQRLFAVFGGAGLALSLPLWVLTTGAGFGVTFGLLLPAIYVLPAIYSERQWQAQKHIEKPHQQWRWQHKKIAANLLMVIHQLLILMLFSSLITLALAAQLPLARPNQIAIGVVLLPLVWGVLSLWQLTSQQPWRPFALTTFGAALSAVYLFV